MGEELPLIIYVDDDDGIEFTIIEPPGLDWIGSDMVVNKIYLSGIQPSGKLHLGNYFGCIKPFLKKATSSITGDRKHIFLIADLHCFTKPENGSDLRTQILEIVRSLLALGVNPETTAIVQQSKVSIIY